VRINYLFLAFFLVACAGFDRLDVIPKEGEVYAFLLKDFHNSVTVKRLIKIDRHFMIIDGDNKGLEDRKS